MSQNAQHSRHGKCEACLRGLPNPPIATFQVARAYKDHCCAVLKGTPGTIGELFDYGVTFNIEHMRLWIACHVTYESGWYASTDPEPQFIKVGRRVLAFYRRNGWTKRYHGYMWQRSKQ